MTVSIAMVRSTNERVGLILLVGFLLFFSQACSGPHDGESGRLQPLVLSSVPAGLRLGGAAQFPEANPFARAEPFELWVYRLQAPGFDDTGTDGELGVFIRPSPPDAEEARSTNAIPSIGPNGLAGHTIVGQGHEWVIASRDLAPGKLVNLAEVGLSELLASLEQDAVLEAHQEIASVPGIGSLPLPSFAAAFVTSYIGIGAGSDGEPFQRSVALGTYRGKGSDLAVLDWWYSSDAVVDDSPNSHTYVVPAYQDLSEANPWVPDAWLTVVINEDGTVQMTRVVGFERAEMASLLSRVTTESVQAWKKETEFVRADASLDGQS